jgi:hypothetical protein
MWLNTVAITNFRNIERLAFNLDRRATVIVGPNAIGKTTLLEAIRLTKATLTPRTLNETQQAFMSLGAISPHNPTTLNYAALARDIARPIEIDATFELSPNELQSLDELVPQFANAIVRAQMGPAANAQGQLALVQFLSSERGTQALGVARQHIGIELPAIKANSRITLNLIIEPTSATIRGAKQLHQLIFTTL